MNLNLSNKSSQLLFIFKEYLRVSKNSSPLTVKNYASDVAQFLRWIENKTNLEFDPTAVTTATFDEYQTDKGVSARSFERHLSSLRKFFTFMAEQKIISFNPFEQAAKELIAEREKQDPWYMKEFKDYLYVFGAADLTIKNYIIDIQGFTKWCEETLQSKEDFIIDDEGLLTKITPEIIHEYKDRLLNVLKLSPNSINRKLSSIRKYFEFLEKTDLLGSNITDETNTQTHISNISSHPSFIEAPKPEEYEATLSLSDITSLDQKSKRKYSKIPPIRLLQKVLIVPYVFAEGAIAAKIASLLPEKVAAQTAVNAAVSTIPQAIKSIPKEFYAPHLISTRNLSPMKKLIFHIKYTRPNWYKTYHSYTFTHYFHIAVLVIFASAIGFAAYNTLVLTPGRKNPTLAAGPIAPPRILSFQGRLTDSSDTPITTTTNIRFAIYDTLAATGSSLLWQEVQYAVAPDQDGVFSINLGTNTTIPQSVFAQNDTLYLGVTIENTSELTPRQRLAAVAFATNAEVLQGMPPITQVAAGTSNVILALDSSGNLTIGGSANPIFQASGGQFKLSGQPLYLTTNTGTSGNIVVHPDGLGMLDVERPIVNITSNGNLSPGAVEIQDKFAINATESAVAAFLVNNNTSGGDIIAASSSGTTKLVLSNAGNLSLVAGSTIDTLTSGTLGIGTTNATTITIGRTGQGITLPAFATNNNSVLYTGAAGALGAATTSSTGSCLVSNGTGAAPSWGTCGAAGTNWWQVTSGMLAPINSTLDFAIGGQATNSAKFAVLNVNSGITTATVAGNIIAYPQNGAGGAVGIGTLSPRYALDVVGNAIVSGNVGIGVSNPTGGKLQVAGDIVPDANGTRNLGTPSLSFNTIYANNIVSGSVGTSGFWSQSNGLLYPANSTVDFALGGTATTSADFAVLNLNSGTPTATVAGNFIIMPNNNGLSNLGGNLGIGTTNPTERFTVGSSVGSLGQFFVNGTGAVTAQAASGQAFFTGRQIGSTYAYGSGIFQAVSDNPNGTQNYFFKGQEGGTSGPLTFTVRADGQVYTIGNVGINTTTPAALLHITGTTTGNAAAIINNSTSSNDIFTASSAGATRFTVAGNGNVALTNGNPFVPTALIDARGGGSTAAFRLRGNSGGSHYFEILNTDATSTELADNWGFISLKTPNASGSTPIDRLHVSLGGFVGIGSTSPTAAFDVQGTAGKGNALAIFNQTQTGTNADVLTASVSGATKFVIDHNGNMGIGTTLPQTTLDVRGTQYLRSSAGDSGILEFWSGGGYRTTMQQIDGASGYFQINSVDSRPFVFTGSGGSVGIGTTTVPALLTVGSTGQFQVTSAGNLSTSGTVTFSGFNANNNVLYATVSTGVLAGASTNSTGLCLISGASAPSWSSCSAAASNYWQLNSGALSPFSNTLDVLVGSTATTSAKFGFLNVASGTPVASISANSGNIATYLTGDGTLATTNRQTLTIGNSSTYNTTGNVLINPNGTGNVGIGTTTTTSKLYVQHDTSGTALLTLRNDSSGGIGIDFNEGGTITSLIKHDIGTNNLQFFTNANTSTAKVVFDANGNVGVGSTTPTSALYLTRPATMNFTGKALAILDQIESQDIFTASASGNTRLTLNGAGQLALPTQGSNGGLLIGTDATLYRSGSTALTSNSTFTAGPTITSTGSFADFATNFTTTGNSGRVLFNENSSNNALIQLMGSTASDPQAFKITNVRAFPLEFATSNTERARFDANGNFGIGTTSPIATLHVEANSPKGNALAIFNQTATGTNADILTASVSGTPVFTVTQGQNVGIGTTLPSAKLAVAPITYGNSQAGGIQLQTTNGNWKWGITTRSNGGGQPYLTIDGPSDASGNTFTMMTFGIGQNSGNVGIGTTTLPALFTVGSSGQFQVTSGGNLTTSGTVTFSGLTSNQNSVVYAGSGGLLSTATTGSSNLCLVSGATTPSWGSCLSGTQNYWQLNNGAISPFSSTTDILIGSTATTSAKFAVLNVASGITTATVAGNIIAYPQNGAGGAVGIGTLTPRYALDVIGNAIVSGNVGIGTSNPTSPLHIVTSSGDGIINIAGSTTTQRIRNNGSEWLAANSGLSLMNGLTSLELRIAGVARVGIDSAGNVGIGTTAPVSTFNVVGTYGKGNALAILNQTQTGTGADIFTASQSGTTRFVITGAGNVGIGSSIPAYKLDINSGSASEALGLTSSNATITYLDIANTSSGAKNWRLQSVGSGVAGRTGNFEIWNATNSVLGLAINSSGNIGIGTTGPGTALLEVGSSSQFKVTSAGNLSTSGSVTFSSFTSNGGVLYTNGSGVLSQVTAGTNTQCLLGGTTPTFGSCATGTSNFWVQNNTAGTLYPGNSTVDLLVGGTATNSAKFAVLNVAGGITTATVAGNIIAYPQNGAGGAIGIGTLSPRYALDVVGNAIISGNVGIGTTTTTTGKLYVDVGSTAGDGVHVNGTANPSYKLYNGGTLKAIMGLATAGNSWIPGSLTNDLAFRTEDSTNGNILFGTANTANVTFLRTGYVGIGTTSPAAVLDVRGTAGKGNALAIFNQTQTGGAPDIFTASASGVPKFVINRGGNVGIGNNAFTSTPHLLYVSGITTGNAVAVFDQRTASSDILAASASGSVRLQLTNGGSLNLVGGQTSDIDTLTGTTLKIGASTATGITIGRSSQSITLPTFTSNGGVLYTNGSGVLSQVTAGTASQCLLGGTTPSFGSCTGANNWVFNSNGTVYPGNSTIDLLMGGTATSSARFAVLNMAAGLTPVASVSSGLNGTALYLTADGTLATAKRGTLTIGNSSSYNTTGNTLINPNGSGYLGIGTTIPSYALDLSASGSTDQFAAARFVSNNSTATAGSVYNALFSTNDTHTSGTMNSVYTFFGQSFYGGTSAASPAITQLNSAYFRNGINGTSPTGTITTANAIFADGLTGQAGGSPNVTITNNNGINVGNMGPISGTTVTNATGITIAAQSGAGTNNIGLSVNGASGGTSNINIYNVQQGTGLTTPGYNEFTYNLQTINTSGGAKNNYAYYIYNNGTRSAGANNLTNIGLYSTAFGGQLNYAAIFDQGNVGIGSTTPGTTLDVTGTLRTSSTVTFSTFSSNGGVLYTNGSGVLSQVTAGTASQCLLGGTTPSFGSCATGQLDLYWNQQSGALFPNNSTVDFLLGGQATTSAKFAVLNVNNGTPVASVSSGLSGTALSFDASGNIQTSNNMTLTLGGNTSGNIALAEKNITLNSTKDGENGNFITPASPDTLPAPKEQGGAAFANGYMYYVGGGTSAGGGATATVWYNRVNANGTLNGWRATTSLPDNRAGHTTIAANGYLYAIGGYNGAGAAQSTVFYARINPDGTVGAWNTLPSLPNVLYSHATVVAGGYVYTIGGFGAGGAATNAVNYAKLNPDGTIGTWTATTVLPNVRTDPAAVVANGYMYVLGGNQSGTDQNTVYYAAIFPNGTVGNWATTTVLPGTLSQATALTANGYIYSIGGFLGGSATTANVYYAALNSDGTIGSWTTSINALPAPLRKHESLMVNGYIYNLAGMNNSSVIVNSVYYSSVARVSIAANLDLLGITSMNMSSASGDLSQGSSGGSIFAGNIFSMGQLSVNGASQFWSPVGINGALSLVGTGRESAPLLFAEGNTGNKALGIFNQLSNTADILTASASGTTQLYLTNGGSLYTRAFYDLDNTTYFLDPAASGNSMIVAGNVGIGVKNAGNPLSSSSPLAKLHVYSELGTSPGASISARTSFAALVVTNDGVGPLITATSSGKTVFEVRSNGDTLLANGTGKIYAAGVDPRYTIDGQRYSTFAPSMAGMKEEITGAVNTSYDSSEGAYTYTFDFNGFKKNSDLWVFSRVIDPNISLVTPLLSASANARTWYTKDPVSRKITVYSDVPTQISYRFTAPRFDYKKWPTIAAADDTVDGLMAPPPPSPIGTVSSDPASVDSTFANQMQIQKRYDSMGNPFYALVDGFGNVMKRVDSFSTLIAANIRAGVVTAQEGAFNSLSVGGKSLRDFIVDVIHDTNRGETVASPLSSAEKIATNMISPLSGDTLTIEGNATVSGKLTTTDLRVKDAATVSGTLTADQVLTNTASISGSLSAADASISGTLTTTNLNATDVHTDSFIAGSATVSGTLYAEHIDGLDDKVKKILNTITPTPTQNATTAGTLSMGNNINVNQNLSDMHFMDISTLSADFALVRENLLSLGSASFTEATVMDQLSIGTTMNLSNNTINTLGADLEINPLRQGGVSFLSGLIKIDTSGNLDVSGNATFAKDVTVKGSLTAGLISPLAEGNLIISLNSTTNPSQQFEIHNASDSAVFAVNQNGDVKASGDIEASGAATFAKLNLHLVDQAFATSDTTAVATGSAGMATLKANKSELTIVNKNVTEKSLIYITPVGATTKVISLLRQVGENASQNQTGSFTVGVSSATTADIKFNWIIVN